MGESCSEQKLKKAKSLKIKTLDEDGFLNLITTATENEILSNMKIDIDDDYDDIDSEINTDKKNVIITNNVPLEKKSFESSTINAPIEENVSLEKKL